MEKPQLTLALDGPIALITLDRPEKLNAITPLMLTQLDDALNVIEAVAAVRAVVLRSASPRAFSVGADINAWSALPPLEMWRSWTRTGHRVLARLAGLRPPVVAALNGYAFGGGLELALAADIRIGAADLVCALPEVTIGTVPGWGGTARLPQLIGVARAKQLIFTGERLNAKDAERWGIVSEIVPPEDLNARAVALARQIAANAPVSVQLAKQLIDSPAAASLALEGLAGALAATTNDGHEGLAAHRERRPPTFQGQ